MNLNKKRLRGFSRPHHNSMLVLPLIVYYYQLILRSPNLKKRESLLVKDKMSSKRFNQNVRKHEKSSIEVIKTGGEW